MLAVVERKKQLRGSDPIRDCRGKRPLRRCRDAKRRSHSRLDQLAGAERGQIHPGHPPAAVVDALARYSSADREPGLARTTRTGQRDQARRPKKIDQAGDVRVATDQECARHWHPATRA